jgi:hypothetical protein
MGRHVILAFHRVHERRIAVPNQPAEQAFQVTANVRICVLLDQQRRGSVTKEKRQQPILKSVLSNPGLDLIGEFVKPATSGRDPDFM